MNVSFNKTIPPKASVIQVESNINSVEKAQRVGSLT